MEPPTDSGRRGSGISLSINRGPPSQKQRAQHQDYYPPMPHGYPSPYYMQAPPYPVLMNPPPLPTYQYGIPPSPYLMGAAGPGMFDKQFPSTPNLRRSNSRMIHQRPPSIAPSEVDYMEGKVGDGFCYNGAPEPNDFGFDKGVIEEQQSVLGNLKRSNSERASAFGSYMESQKAKEQQGKGYSVRKGEFNAGKQQYPGVIIEEMLDSVSVHSAEQINYPVALIDADNVEPAPKEPDAMSVLGQEQFSASIPQKAPVRWRSSTPINTMILFVPQQEAWVVERMGKFSKILEPGLNVLVPVIDKIKYVQSLKEIAIDVPSQSAITIDNVTLNIDGVLYLRIKDPYKASYGVEDPEFAITQLAQTTMRSEIGKITLDTLFRERDNLNAAIVIAINQASEAWGIQCMRYEIRDIRMPSRVQEAMQMQVEAERKKRAAILESEGIKTAEINVAEGKKQAQILQSEAEKQQLINEAQGAAEAVVAAGKARAQSIEMVSKALGEVNGSNAAALAVAEKYVSAFQNLARTNNTLILPSNTGDVSSMVAQAMTIYHQLQSKPTNGEVLKAELNEPTELEEPSDKK